MRVAKNELPPPLAFGLGGDFLRLYAVTNNYNLPAVCMMRTQVRVRLGKLK